MTEMKNEELKVLEGKVIASAGYDTEGVLVLTFDDGSALYAGGYYDPVAQVEYYPAPQPEEG